MNTKWLMLTCVLSFTCCSLNAQQYYDTSVKNPLTDQNIYLNQQPVYNPVPKFVDVKANLPEPVWPARKDVIACYWKAWELTFSNVRAATQENGFIAPYISPAFNNHLFMWDTSFMALFGRYGFHSFNFQGSLDNFYHKQHKDGYICREISEQNGAEIFAKYDPSSTGPNIMPWAEWDYFLYTKDKDRLAKVFPVLLAYYEWFQQYRSWPDGSYYSSGWGCGMDNQPRLPFGYNPEFSHGFMSWIDTSLQQLFTAKVLVKMAKVLGRENDIRPVTAEIGTLTAYVQKYMWDEKTAYFYDRFRDGSLSQVKSIAAYWALLAEVVPEGRLNRFITHLENPAEFARTHRVPTLSADSKDYVPEGGYWRGGVWAPTTYMVLKGLTAYKQDSLAYAIAFNHLDNVAKVYSKTGTLWENYAPDFVEGKYRKDLVGWTGLVPISVLFEYVFGLSPDKEPNVLVWDIRLLDEFGINNYPYGTSGRINLHCAKRRKLTDKPVIKVKSNEPIRLKLIWKGGMEVIKITPEKE